MHQILKMSNSCTRIWLNLNLDFKSNAASNLKQKALLFKDELHPSWLQSYLLRMCCDISTGSISAMHTQVYFTMTWLGLMSWIVFCKTTIQCLTIAGEFMLSLISGRRIDVVRADGICSELSWWQAAQLLALVTVSLWESQFTSLTNFSHLFAHLNWMVM